MPDRGHKTLHCTLEREPLQMDNDRKGIFLPPQLSGKERKGGINPLKQLEMRHNCQASYKDRNFGMYAFSFACNYSSPKLGKINLNALIKLNQ